MGVLDTATTQARYTAASGDPVLLEPLMTKYNSGVRFFATAPSLEFDVAYTVEAFSVSRMLARLPFRSP